MCVLISFLCFFSHNPLKKVTLQPNVPYQVEYDLQFTSNVGPMNATAILLKDDNSALRTALVYLAYRSHFQFASLEPIIVNTPTIVHLILEFDGHNVPFLVSNVTVKRARNAGIVVGQAPGGQWRVAQGNHLRYSNIAISNGRIVDGKSPTAQSFALVVRLATVEISDLIIDLQSKNGVGVYVFNSNDVTVQNCVVSVVNVDDGQPSEVPAVWFDIVSGAVIRNNAVAGRGLYANPRSGEETASVLIQNNSVRAAYGAHVLMLEMLSNFTIVGNDFACLTDSSCRGIRLTRRVGGVVANNRVRVQRNADCQRSFFIGTNRAEALHVSTDVGG